MATSTEASVSPTSSAGSSRRQPAVGSGTGLAYGVAKSLEDAQGAWRLVYRAYLRTGLIAPNHLRIHTLPHAVGDGTMVVLGRIGPVTVSTLSTYLDGEHGLPLDSVYRKELDARREAGRKLVETGLFADRRAKLTRSADSLFELMRFAFYFARVRGADDLIIGVHPRHAPFYRRFLGFEVCGEERNYSVVNDNPVVLLLLDLAARLNETPRRRGIAFFEQHPLGPADFADCYRFPRQELETSDIGEFLRLRAGDEPG